MKFTGDSREPGKARANGESIDNLVSFISAKSLGCEVNVNPFFCRRVAENVGWFGAKERSEVVGGLGDRFVKPDGPDGLGVKLAIGGGDLVEKALGEQLVFGRGVGEFLRFGEKINVVSKGENQKKSEGDGNNWKKTRH